MQLIEKTKVYFAQPIFVDIGDEKELEEERKEEVGVRVADARANGFFEGSLVVLHTSLSKDKVDDWGVIVRVYDQWPEVANKYVPFEVKWFSGSNYGKTRYSDDDLFVIQEGPEQQVLSVLDDYNYDTSDLVR